MEVYNPALEEDKDNSSKSKMEILTEYILEELNSYIEDEKRAYKHIPIFNGLLPGINKDVIDTTIKLSKSLVKALITNNVDLFIDSLSGLGAEHIKYLSRESQIELCKSCRLELYKNAEKAFENNK